MGKQGETAERAEAAPPDEFTPLDNMIICLHYLSREAKADNLDKVAVKLDEALKVALAVASKTCRDQAK